METCQDSLEVKMEFSEAAEFSSEEDKSDWPENNVWSRVSKAKCRPFTCIESNTSHTDNDVKSESSGARNSSDRPTDTETDTMTEVIGSKSIPGIGGQRDKRSRSDQPQFFPSMPGLKRVNLLSEFRKNKPRQDNESHEAYLHRTHVEYSQLSGEARQTLLKQVSRERLLDSPRKKREFAIRLSKKMKQLQKFIEERGGMMSFHALIGGRHVMAVSSDIQDIEERLQYNEEIECVTVSTPENEVDVSDGEEPVEPKKETTTALRKKTLRHQVQKILNAAFSKASGIEGTRCPYSNLPPMDVIGWPYGVASIRNPKHYGVGDLKKIIKNKDIISFNIFRKDGLPVSRTGAAVAPAPPSQPTTQTPAIPMVGSGPDACHSHQCPNGSFPNHTDLRPVGPFTTHTDLQPIGPFVSPQDHQPGGPFTNHSDQNPTGEFTGHADQRPGGSFAGHTDLRPIGPFASHPDHCQTGPYASHPDQRPNGPFASQLVADVARQQDWGQGVKGHVTSIECDVRQSAPGPRVMSDLGSTESGALVDQSNMSKKSAPYAYQQLLDGELQALFAAITGGDTVQATSLTAEVPERSEQTKGPDPVQATSVTTDVEDKGEHSEGPDVVQASNGTRPVEDKDGPSKGADIGQAEMCARVLQDKSEHSEEEENVHGTSSAKSEDKNGQCKGRDGMQSINSTKKLKNKNKHKAANKPPFEEVKEPPAKRFRKVWTAEEDAYILKTAGSILHLSDVTIKRIITQEPLFVGRSESSIRGRLLRLRRKEAAAQ